MATESIFQNYYGWNNEIVTKHEDNFGSYDFCDNSYSMNWHELPFNESYLETYPKMESYVISDPLYSSLNIEQSSNVIQDDVNGVWSDLGSLFEPQINQQVLLLSDSSTMESSNGGYFKEENKAAGAGRFREQKATSNNSISRALTRDVISECFYMPITQAAKELNVGLTLLKKRCRELGIRRWPHRKLMSMQTLIKNVQEMKRNNEESEEQVKQYIEVLERERKMIEEMPDAQLESTTKRLRQACFKANYKKRKMMNMIDHHPSSSNGNSIATNANFNANNAAAAGCHDMIMMNEDDHEELKFLMNEPFYEHESKLMF